MYPEFIPIYVGLGIIVFLLLVVILLLIVFTNKIFKGKKINKKSNDSNRSSSNIDELSGIIICRNCHEQYSANENICPSCGLVRKKS